MSQVSPEMKKQRAEVPSPRLYSVVKFATEHLLLKNVELTSNGIENIPFTGGVSAAANHRNDDQDVLAAGLVLSERRAAFYPAKRELDTFIRGRVLENCGALFFVRGDRHEAKRISDLSSQHVRDGHFVLTFIEGTSKNTGRELGQTFNSATRYAIENELDEVVLVGIGGTDTPFRTDEKGVRKKKREKTDRIHIEIGSVPLKDAVAPYRLAEKPVPKYIQKEIHNDIVVPALQEIVDIAYGIAA